MPFIDVIAFIKTAYGSKYLQRIRRLLPLTFLIQNFVENTADKKELIKASISQRWDITLMIRNVYFIGELLFKKPLF